MALRIKSNTGLILDTLIVKLRFKSQTELQKEQVQ